MLLMKNVKVIKKEKGQSEWLDLRLRMNYIASWGQRMGKITKTRERKTRDLKCVTIKGQSVLVKEQEIKQRWKSYFDELLNGSHSRT